MRGEVLHEWSFPLCPGNYAYLLPTRQPALGRPHGGAGPPLWRGKGGLLREYTWDGEVVWEYCDPAQHHDFRRRPDGNTIYIGWEPVPADVQPRGSRAATPGSEHEGVTYGDYVREVSPAGETVWEWHAWRDLDLDRWELCHSCGRDEFAHANACFPLDDGGVMLSFRRLNAIMMIDRDTCKVRWSHQDPTWGHQHDCTLLPNGNILLFANGIHGLDNPFSRVIELDPETGGNGLALPGLAHLDLLQPQHQRRPALRQRQHAHLRGPDGTGLRGHPGRRDRLGVRLPVLCRLPGPRPRQ